MLWDSPSVLTMPVIQYYRVMVRRDCTRSRIFPVSVSLSIYGVEPYCCAVLPSLMPCEYHANADTKVLYWVASHISALVVINDATQIRPKLTNIGYRDQSAYQPLHCVTV